MITLSPPALAPTLVDFKAICGKIKETEGTFDGQNMIIQNYDGLKLRLESHQHSQMMLKNGSCPKLAVIASIHGPVSRQPYGDPSLLGDSTAACAITLKKLMQGNMRVKPFYDCWMTVYEDIYPDTNEEVKFDAFCEKLSEHSIWRCTSLADAVTCLHNCETCETKDNSSPVSQFINHIIKDHQMQVVATLKETEKQ
ncbi:hypothetical protein QOT17_024232 [Balamuthia mandrillaris]